MVVVRLSVAVLLTGAVAVRLRQHADNDEFPVRPREWKDAISMAAKTLKDMTLAEKVDLLRGSDSDRQHHYHGNTKSLIRLNVPALKMEDSGSGFRIQERQTAGTTVMWPCPLAMTATWDEQLVHMAGSAIGKEFRMKGANVMLGPAVNVHRISNGGRNWEYMSGEDPVLGSKMVGPFIRGVQGQGVMTAIKHFAFNEQEDIQHANVKVDARTAWELYYPPFQAAINAGAGAVMCSRTMVNGSYACESWDLLRRTLKQDMGFNGFVMSNFGAIHGPFAIGLGADMDLPGGKFDEKTMNSSVFHEATDDAVVRVLSAMFALRMDREIGCVPPQCTDRLMRETRENLTLEIANEVAEDSVVLMKNRRHFLPLKPDKIQKIAVLGRAAAARVTYDDQQPDYFAGGGSGHVPPSRARKVPTVLEAITERAHELGINVSTHHSGKWEENWFATSDVDAVIIVAAASSTEGKDRPTLKLDDNVDTLITEVSKVKKTAVLMITPGAVTTPWREVDNVRAIVNQFLPGEFGTRALAKVVFGDKNPEGKLPVTMPISGEDRLPRGYGTGDLKYSEGVFTGYRVGHEVAFPFGHGLSYTKFQFLQPEVSTKRCTAATCIRLTVENMGARPGREVPQAYVEFPQEAHEPKLLLRAFHKTNVLEPGQHQDIWFTFSERDLSIYNTTLGWVRQNPIKIHFGASSGDIRHTVEI